jgi:hypothetical protein
MRASDALGKIAKGGVEFHAQSRRFTDLPLQLILNSDFLARGATPQIGQGNSTSTGGHKSALFSSVSRSKAKANHASARSWILRKSAQAPAIYI